MVPASVSEPRVTLELAAARVSRAARELDHAQIMICAVDGRGDAGDAVASLRRTSSLDAALELHEGPALLTASSEALDAMRGRGVRAAVIVVRCRQTTQQALVCARERLLAADIDCLGVIVRPARGLSVAAIVEAWRRLSLRVRGLFGGGAGGDATSDVASKGDDGGEGVEAECPARDGGINPIRSGSL
jgi:hypothetical protein